MKDNDIKIAIKNCSDEIGKCYLADKFVTLRICDVQPLINLAELHLSVLKSGMPSVEEIAGELLALKDEHGNDPFIRYQDGRASKGWLRHLIAQAIRERLGKGGKNEI